MFCVKKIVNFCELKRIEEESRQNVFEYIAPVKQKLENTGYAIENKFFYTNKKTAKRKIYECEFRIYPGNLTKSEAKKQFKLKVFRLFIYEKEQLNKCNFKITFQNDFYFKLYFALTCKLLFVVGDIEKSAKDNIFDFILRVFTPNRAGELVFKFKGRDYEWIRILLPLSLAFAVGIIAVLKETEFLSYFGYGYY